MEIVLASLAGAAFGALLALLWGARRAHAAADWCGRAQRAEQALAQARSQIEAEQQARVRAETEREGAARGLAEERRTLEEAKARLSDAFKALAGDALQQSNAAFLSLATTALDRRLADARGDLGQRQAAIDGLVKPLADTLRQFDEHVRGLERNRQAAYTALDSHVQALAAAQQQLQRETAGLVTALRAPQVRGRWGELTLRRTVELAGMSDHCDFSEQVSVAGEGIRQRPDLVVHLPGGREIVVDAKVALDAFLDAAAAAGEDQRRKALGRHAAQVRDHMMRLADKRYWDQFPQAPEFVVMFIPGESFFAAAADMDRQLIEDALARRVVLATPATLIALIRSVAFGWRQDQVARNAQAISDLGRQLHDRMRILAEHLAGIGDGLEKASQAYNRAAGSLEARVLPAARRFRDLGAAGGDDIPVLAPVETAPRALAAPDAADSPSNAGT